MQPVRRPRRKVAFDTHQSRLLRCMDGPQIKTHRGQKVGSELCSGIGAQLHLARISRDPAKHKTVLYGQKRIGRPECAGRQIRKRGCQAKAPWAKSQGEGTRASPPPPTRPPRHFAIATYRGRPRLPPPLTREAKRTMEAHSGSDFFSPPATSGGGSASG